MNEVMQYHVPTFMAHNLSHMIRMNMQSQISGSGIGAPIPIAILQNELRGTMSYSLERLIARTTEDMCK